MKPARKIEADLAALVEPFDRKPRGTMELGNFLKALVRAVDGQALAGGLAPETFLVGRYGQRDVQSKEGFEVGFLSRHYDDAPVWHNIPEQPRWLGQLILLFRPQHPKRVRRRH